MHKKAQYDLWPFLVSTFFGIGRFPYFPGTIGSIIAFPLYLLIVMLIVLNKGAETTLTPVLINSTVLFVTLCGFILGCYASGKYSKQSGKNDPGEIIIDEVIGQLLLVSLVIMTIPNLIESQAVILKFSLEKDSFYYILLFISFVSFRILDICKPWPINVVDEKIKGGIGIMLDDIVAALFSYILIICGLLVIGS